MVFYFNNMPCCSAVNCSNRTEKGHRLFPLPKGERNAERRKKWLQNIGRKTFPNTIFVCQDHFTDNQFENNRKDGRKLLRWDAIPTVFDHRTLPKPKKPPPRRVCPDMPGMRCTVAVCNNSYMKSRISNPKLMYHKFPKDPKIRKIWVQRCRRNGKWNPETLRVCSAHFSSDDYERDLKSELLGIESKPILKKTAVPSLNLLPASSTKNESCKNNERASRLQRRQNKKIVAEILQKTDFSSPVANGEKAEASSSINIETNENADNSVSEQNKTGENLNVSLLQKRIQILEKEYILLKMNSQKIEKQLKATQQKLDTEKIVTCSLKRELSHLKRQKIPNAVIEKKAIEMLKPLLTKNQINILLKKKEATNWSKDEIAIALTLRYLSKRAYVYLRKELNFPLPSLSTLQQLTSKFCLEKGILQDVLKVMKIASYKYTLSERLAVIHFDEVKIKYTYEYDSNTDQIIGPHSNMQMVMVCGLTSPWKQPIYVDFDSKITKETLLLIITNLEDVGYPVVACVCDMFGGNMERMIRREYEVWNLWREMGIYSKRPWIRNPQNIHRKIYFFADAPNLLRMIRNWFFETGFVVNGTTVTKDPIVQLIISQDNELKTYHKLQNDHVNCHGAQRQNVRLAREFSHSTAIALKHYKPINEKLALDTANFVELVNTWFDIMNSYTQNASIPEKCGYGEHLEEQDKVLQEMLTTFTNLRCVGKKDMQLFQKGIIISIKSLQMLYRDLSSIYGIKFFLTHRLNQDSLKNFFFHIRRSGELNDHPTPLNALYRIKMIILGKSHGNVCQIPNTNSWSEDYYLVSKVFTTVGINPQIECPEVLLTENQDNVCGNNIPEILIVNHCSNELQNPLLEMKENGLNYIGGWIAWKLHHSYPYLGMPTRNACYDHDYCTPFLIHHLLHEILYDPTPEFKEQLKQLEIFFPNYENFLELSKEKGLLEKTSIHLAKSLPNIPKDVINSFTRIRTFIRLRYLNRQIEKRTSW